MFSIQRKRIHKYFEQQNFFEFSEALDTYIALFLKLEKCIMYQPNSIELGLYIQ